MTLGFIAPSHAPLPAANIKWGSGGDVIKDYILLIEDREDDALLTQRALLKHGITTDVVVAKDGAEALELLFSGEATLPCFVLIDLKLPKVSGVKVLERLRAEKATSHLPVIVLSTSQEELQALRKRDDLAAFDYVSKAFGSEDFMQRLAVVKNYCPI